MKNRFFLSIVIITLFIGSCQKDEDPENGKSVKMELITKAPWIYESAKIDANKDGVGDMDVPAGILLDCDLDNIITLKTDGTGTVDEGSTKCEVDDPQTVSLTWQFKNNETVIHIPDTIYGAISGDAQIKTLTDTKLQLVKAFQITSPLPTEVNVIVDLKH